MPNEIRNKSVDYLARREHSRFELFNKLKAKGFEEADIEAELEHLETEGLLSDGRFTEMFVLSRRERGSGPVKIRAELKTKGVSEDTISDYLDMRANQWHEMAAEVRIKRFGESLPDDFKEKSRQARFLQQRGFSADQVRWVLNDDSI